MTMGKTLPASTENPPFIARLKIIKIRRKNLASEDKIMLRRK